MKVFLTENVSLISPAGTKRCKLLTSSDDKSPEKIKPNRMQMFSAYKKSRTNLTWHSREAETCTGELLFLVYTIKHFF